MLTFTLWNWHFTFTRTWHWNWYFIFNSQFAENILKRINLKAYRAEENGNVTSWNQHPPLKTQCNKSTKHIFWMKNSRPIVYQCSTFIRELKRALCNDGTHRGPAARAPPATAAWQSARCRLMAHVRSAVSTSIDTDSGSSLINLVPCAIRDRVLRVPCGPGHHQDCVPGRPG